MDMIKVTGVDLRKLIAAVYANSYPQGMGHFHYQAGEIPQKLLEDLVGSVRINALPAQGQTECIFSMDYVLGRACKFQLFMDDNEDLWIRKIWFDHNEMDLRRMLRDSGLKEDLANG